MSDQAEHEFEVVARTYAHLVVFGERPEDNLAQIGRDMGLDAKQINSVRLRASHQAKKYGRPRDVDDKRWTWPTKSEIAQRAREIAENGMVLACVTVFFVTGCAELAPTDSPLREQQREFQEHHMEAIRP